MVSRLPASRAGMEFENDHMKIGFIGLGNIGGKLAGSLLRNGLDLMVRDLDSRCRAAVS